MTIQSINPALQAIQTLAAQAKNQPVDLRAVAQQGGGFMGELQSSIRKVNQLQQHATAKTKAFQLGEPGVELNDVMVDMQKASISMQMATQVRNRLITAYKEVMNMPV